MGLKEERQIVDLLTELKEIMLRTEEVLLHPIIKDKTPKETKEMFRQKELEIVALKEIIEENYRNEVRRAAKEAAAKIEEELPPKPVQERGFRVKRSKSVVPHKRRGRPPGSTNKKK